ncbi:MAG: SixA phosphatase family protein [Anaerolineales bacterium]
MRLYFVRHGLAHWPSWPGNDAERPLNPEGIAMMKAAAAGLARRGVQPELILYSPLLRARQTAEIIAEALSRTGYLREHHLLEPGFNPKALRDLVHEHPALSAVMFVGHAPDMGEVVTHLTGHAVKFKEGTVAHVKVKEPEKKHLKGKLEWIATADELAGE